MPLPSSNPATTLVRGTISMCQCISRAATPGGAVCTITLYGAPGRARWTAASASRVPRATTASSASVASSMRGAGRAVRDPHLVRRPRRRRAPRGRRPVDHHEVGAARDRQLGRDEVGGEALRHGDDGLGGSVRGDDLRVGVLDGGARARARGSRTRRRTRAPPPGGGGPDRAGRRTPRWPGRRSSAAKSRSWSGERITTSWAPVASPASGAPTIG